MEADTSFLEIYDGGSEQAEMISKLKEAMNGTKISTPKNQIFLVLNINGNNPINVRLNAEIIESKYLEIVQVLYCIFSVSCPQLAKI